MTVIVSVNPDMAEFESGDDQQPPQLRLILTDTDGQQHQLVLEGAAIGEVVEIFRGIQEQFPGALGAH